MKVPGGAYPLSSVLVELPAGWKTCWVLSPLCIKIIFASSGAPNTRIFTPSLPKEAPQDSQSQAAAFWFYCHYFISISSKGVEVKWIGSHTTS